MATCIGISVSAVALLYAVHGRQDPGIGESGGRLPSLLVITLSLGGVQLFFIGIIGEYLGRMFYETKNRSLYLVKVHEPSEVEREHAEYLATREAQSTVIALPRRTLIRAALP